MTQTNSEFNRAENASPRSGSSKRLTPAIWCVIVLAIVALAVYFAMKA
jgi:hypothetical protein